MPTLINQLIPVVGVKGKYVVATPYTTLVPSTIDYECIAVQEFKHLNALGVDPYETVYLPVQLTRENAAEDEKVGVRIVTLMTASGVTVRVPSRYITGIPDSTALKYVNTSIVALLSAMPENTSVSTLTTTIAALIENTLGITPNVKLVKYGVSEAVTEVEHQAVVASRNRRMTTQTNPIKEALDYKAKYEAEKAKRVELEKLLIQHGIYK